MKQVSQSFSEARLFNSYAQSTVARLLHPVLRFRAYSGVQTAGGGMTRNLIADVIVRKARSIDEICRRSFADAEGRQRRLASTRRNAASRALRSVRTVVQGLTFGLILLLLLPLMIIVALAAATLEN